MNFGKKVSGHALVYALLVMSIITTMSSMALLKLSNYKFSQLKRSSRSGLIEAERNLIKLALSKHFLPNTEKNPFSINLIQNVNSTIYRSNWGAFELLVFKNKCSMDSLTSSALIGQKEYKFRKTAIYIKNNNRPLYVSGSALIRGNSYLAKAGIRKAIINNDEYCGKKLINGELYVSSNKLPEPDLSEVHDFLSKHKSSRYNNIKFRDSIQSSFAGACTILNLKGNAVLKNGYYRGNIIISASDKIYVSNSTFIEDAILIAPKIEIESGSSLSAQFIASKQILISEHCILKYPSFVYLKEGKKESKINVGKNSKIEGLLIFTSSELKNQKAGLFIGEGAEITGLLYSESTVDLKGDIAGTIICDNIQYSTEQNLYLSSLYNVRIDNNALPEYFVLNDLYQNNSNKYIMKWLN